MTMAGAAHRIKRAKPHLVAHRAQGERRSLRDPVDRWVFDYGVDLVATLLLIVFALLFFLCWGRL